MKHRIAAAAMAAALLLTPLLVAAPAHAGLIDGSLNNLHAADKSNILGALAGSRITDANGSLNNTRSGARENLNANVLAGGVDISIGGTQLTGNGGSETFDVPMQVELGGVADGEQVQVTVIDTETDIVTGIDLQVVTLTATFTCHLDSSGNGVCD